MGAGLKDQRLQQGFINLLLLGDWPQPFKVLSHNFHKCAHPLIFTLHSPFEHPSVLITGYGMPDLRADTFLSDV